MSSVLERLSVIKSKPVIQIHRNKHGGKTASICTGHVGVTRFWVNDHICTDSPCSMTFILLDMLPRPYLY